MTTNQIATKEDFLTNWQPYLVSQEIDFGLVDKKHFNRQRQEVTLFSTEVRAQTFIVVNNLVYKLTQRKEDLEFNIRGQYGIAVKLPFEEEYFRPVPLFQLNTIDQPPVADVTQSINTVSAGTQVDLYSAVATMEAVVDSVPGDDAFNVFLDKQLNQIRHILIVKAREYVRNNNRWHNFESIGGLNMETPERALWGLVSKQIISLRDIVLDLENRQITPTQAMIDEKCGDVEVYTLLLHGLFNKRIVDNAGRLSEAANQAA
ncbi:hypothetical protein GCM10028806_33820 [Spirosoma terrae]|uniref:Uncharacterized protein n=1 Tax=Spirosoma terrae TaxID=1968276 RepID=A0A6L9L5B6_9BACT|nr:hypothetical protein [Spirosoma terrae]NDU95694.1 hypothetical protein [Spirosoma terrae]